MTEAPDPEQSEGWMEPRTGLFLVPDAFFVEGQLTSQSDQFTSERGALAEEGGEKDHQITESLLSEKQEFAHRIRDKKGFECFSALKWQETDRLHNFSKSLEVRGYEVFRVDRVKT